MVEKRTCDYTGEEIEPGTGIMYVQTDGSVLHFVDSKAEKNYKLGREPRDLEWTEEGRRGKQRAAPEPEVADDEVDEDEGADEDEVDEDEGADEDDVAESETEAEDDTEAQDEVEAESEDADEDEETEDDA